MLNLKTKQNYLPIRDGKFFIKDTGGFSEITENLIKEWWQKYKAEMGSWNGEEFAYNFGELIHHKCQVVMRSTGPDPELVQFEAVFMTHGKILSRKLITLSDRGKDIFIFNLPTYLG